MKLYSYYRSSASYRVRIAICLKGLEAEQVPVNLLKGEQRDEAYRALNPQGLVPSLATDGGDLLTQSLAIMEYLDEAYPDSPTLLPEAPVGRARVRSLSQAIACEVAPLNNLKVLHYLVREWNVSEEQKLAWIHHWIKEGFSALEKRLQEPQTGQFCHGDTPTMADCCLVPQVYNAKRFECDLTAYPTLMRIVETCETLEAFKATHPANQPDTPQ